MALSSAQESSQALSRTIKRNQEVQEDQTKAEDVHFVVIGLLVELLR